MSVFGVVFQRGPLEVEARSTQSGRALQISVFDRTCLTCLSTYLLPADVRELHRDLGAWLDAVEQEAVAKSLAPVGGA